MDVDAIISFLHGWILLLGSFVLALGYSMFKGRQNLINLMMGSYMALLLYHLVPHRDSLLDQLGSDKNQAVAAVAIFIALTFLATWLFVRLMPREFLEGAFETMGKKLLLSIAAMVLVMTLITHYLPVAEVVNIGTPLPEALLSEKFAFLWLVLPLVAMFLV
jgi:hypothetical protein